MAVAARVARAAGVPRVSTIVTDPERDFAQIAGRFQTAKFNLLRKAYRELMQQAEAGRFERIVVWQTSRLWRNRQDIAHIGSGRNMEVPQLRHSAMGTPNASGHDRKNSEDRR